jgi:hypothetical protein
MTGAERAGVIHKQQILEKERKRLLRQSRRPSPSFDALLWLQGSRR